jgi:hypothetical protein
MLAADAARQDDDYNSHFLPNASMMIRGASEDYAAAKDKGDYGTAAGHLGRAAAGAVAGAAADTVNAAAQLGYNIIGKPVGTMLTGDAMPDKDFMRTGLFGRGGVDSAEAQPRAPVAASETPKEQSRTAQPIERPPMSPIPPRQPRTEQQMLDSMAPAGGSVTRDGRVFRVNDPMAMRGREAERAPAGRVVQPGEVLRGNSADDQPIRGGWLAGRPQAGRMLREARAYDHLPISGVTYSDSVQGLGLGQRTPPAADAQTMEELKGLYKKEAVGRAGERVAMGLPGVRQALVNRPAVTTADRAQDISAMRDATRQDQMVTQAATELKPSERLAREQFDYTQQKDQQEVVRQNEVDFQTAIKRRRETQTPPLGLSPNLYASLSAGLMKQGFMDDEIDFYLYSLDGKDPDLENALASGEDIKNPFTGELDSPLNILRMIVQQKLSQPQ